MISGDPEREAVMFCGLVQTLRMLQAEVVVHAPDAEAQIDRDVNAAVRTILAAWEGQL